MIGVPTDTFEINTDNKSANLSVISSKSFTSYNYKKQKNIIKIKEYIQKDLNDINIFGKWLTSLTPDDFYLAAEESIFNDFKTIFNFGKTYGDQTNITDVMMFNEEEGTLLPDVEYLKNIEHFDNAQTFLHNCSYQSVESELDADFIFITKNKKTVFNDKKMAQEILKIYKYPELAPRIVQTKDIIAYNCLEWRKILLTCIFDPLGSIKGVMIQHNTPKLQKLLVENSVSEMLKEEKDNRIFKFIPKKF